MSETDSGCHGEDSLTHDSHKDEKVGGTCKAVTHSIILDISTTGFVDTVTVKMLKNVCWNSSQNHQKKQISDLSDRCWGWSPKITRKFFFQIFGDFADVDLDIYLAGCQGKQMKWRCQFVSFSFTFCMKVFYFYFTLHVTLIGNLSACVVEQLEKASFFESIPKSRLFVSVHDAVLHILGKLGQTKIVLVSDQKNLCISLDTYYISMLSS